ncbi:MAG: hypothetical protein EOP07_24495 [Proteobacteria bacterium]|nr:MAG: hypothetical protein EOP07_24495 [Pseudomonadota bacterium]
MSQAYNASETVIEGEKAVWDAVKSKSKVFVTKDLKNGVLPKLKGGGVYNQDSAYPAAGINQGGGEFKRWTIIEK